MNPLFVFFFAAIVLEDFLFREAKLITYLINSVMVYWVFYYFVKKSTFHSAYRKMLLAEYSQSYDPTVYVNLKLDTKKAKEFISDLEKKIEKKISWTLFFTKCAADIFKKYPEFNQAIKFGNFHEKKTSDFSVLVDVGGKDVAFFTLRDCANKPFKQLIDELYPNAKNLKEGKDETYKKEVNQAKDVPSFMIALLLEIMGFLSNLGITVKQFGIQANKFGSVLVSSLGGFKLSNALAPLCPFTYTSVCVTICTAKNKKILNKDGSITESEILPINLAIDNRFINGAVGAKMMKELSDLFLNPERIEII